VAGRLTLDRRGCLLTVVNQGDNAGPRWVESLKDTAANAILHVAGVAIGRYTIPLVLEGRYFLVEAADEGELWTVFFFLDGQLYADYIRSAPREHPYGAPTKTSDSEMSYWDAALGKTLYTIGLGGTETQISVSYEQSTLTHGVIDGCLILHGPTCVINADEGCGVPVGMWAWRDYKISFRLPLPDEFEKLLGEPRGS
jgi:hypothetical protein